MDEKIFSNCHYKSCILIYGGGDFGWADCRFENCQLRFEGTAARTVAFLKHFNLITGIQTPSAPPAKTTQTIQ
ncbi:MAG: hypothetical protein LAP85_14705 [Acidobacteriia bacterium]|nr:hypothetical protein [Terriglobia bacterium]